MILFLIILIIFGIIGVLSAILGYISSRNRKYKIVSNKYSDLEYNYGSYQGYDIVYSKYVVLREAGIS